MSNLSHIHVRPLEVGDFNFVQDLASRQPTFTVPPAYVLWLMLRIKGAICLIAEHSGEGPLGYLLALAIEDPEHAIFVWQLASSKNSQQENATLALLTEFRNIIKGLAIRRIVFSSVPGSSNYRVIRKYAWKVFSSIPREIHLLPPLVEPRESEFVLDVQRD